MIRDNYVMKIGYNDSGMFSGEIDYSYVPHKIEKMSNEDLLHSKFLLKELYSKLDKECETRNLKTSLPFKIKKVIYIPFIPFGSRYKLWPIHFKWKQWKPDPFITLHGWQVSWKNGKQVYGWTLHLGKFLICFGGKK